MTHFYIFCSVISIRNFNLLIFPGHKKNKSDDVLPARGRSLYPQLFS